VRSDNGSENKSEILPATPSSNGLTPASSRPDALPSRPSNPPATIGTKDSGGQPAAAVLSSDDKALLGMIAERFVDGDKAAGKTLGGMLKAKALELAGPNPSPLVLSLSVTAAVCWWEVSKRAMNLQINRTIDRDYWDKAYTRAFNRWLKISRTLATIQRINPPMVQINLAAQGHQQIVNAER
jgi:hypothetical protein